jgi:hypothetical protein
VQKPSVGPDAARYLLAGMGEPVSRPFHLRWLLPKVCGQEPGRWWTVWGLSWVVAATGMFWWRFAAGDDWRVSGAATVLLLALPGILGPPVSIPIQVDLPATALMLVGMALFTVGTPAATVAGVVVMLVAASIRETAPIWAALTLWSAWPLVALAAPLIAAAFIRSSKTDPLGGEFQYVADHPVRSALAAHADRWRDGWLMVAPWGVCLAGLVGADWRLILILAVAYAQLLVATDTVRLLHHAAGPAMAAAAAQFVPVEWLLLAVAVHVVWWRKPERI